MNKKSMLVLAFVLTGSVFGMKNKVLKVQRLLSDDAKKCLECHVKKTPGIVNDWKNSRHGHVSVTCIDCHKQEKDSPLASDSCPGSKEMGVPMSIVVTPNTCAKCHPQEVEEFKKSGHIRAATQIIPKKGLDLLKNVHEGQNHPMYKNAPDENGCMQCHGSIIKLDKNKVPTSDTWPNNGIGTVWPDGSIGNCSVCHTRHKFSIEEARKPEACASCHIGPDHPNYEIFESSKHGHIYETQGDTYKFDSAPDAWEPGDYRAPTCAVCHISGIGELATTHNVSRRLYWNLWAKESKVRNTPDTNSPWTGNGIQGRAEMKKVCANCHSSKHTKGFFEQGDKQVKLYNEAYYQEALKMKNELAKQNLLHKNPWKDPFQIAFYYLWHHEGRIMRMGPLMGSADYSHWHGSFKVMRRFYEMQEIYKKRLKTKKVESF